MKNKFHITSFIAILMSFQYGCHAGNSEEKTAACSTKSDIATVAAEYIKSHVPPAIEDLKFPVLIEDKKALWEVSYELPPGEAGGTAHVLIDKKTCSVLKVELYQ